jgi:hypothetical protein
LASPAALRADQEDRMRLDSGTYRGLADAVLVLHAGVVLFVVAGLALTLVGGALRWRWVRNFWFRAAHLAAINDIANINDSLESESDVKKSDEEKKKSTAECR